MNSDCSNHTGVIECIFNLLKPKIVCDELYQVFLTLEIVFFADSGDGEVVEQVISQQSAESEEVRHSALDFAIRQLQEHQDRRSGAPGEVGVAAPARVPEPGTPRRGA